jgi:hypothetical protein
MNNKTIKLSELPQPPASSSFGLVEIKVVSMPHPYCITPGHVAYAADHYSGMLSKDAIREAEKTGACCDTCRKNAIREAEKTGAYYDTCRKSGNGILSIDEHTDSLTLFIRVPQNKDLNAIAGLHTYLYSNKAAFVAMGIEGFAFPIK